MATISADMDEFDRDILQKELGRFQAAMKSVIDKGPTTPLPEYSGWLHNLISALNLDPEDTTPGPCGPLIEAMDRCDSLAVIGPLIGREEALELTKDNPEEFEWWAPIRGGDQTVSDWMIENLHNGSHVGYLGVEVEGPYGPLTIYADSCAFTEEFWFAVVCDKGGTPLTWASGAGVDW